jgi:phage terminase small subunit
MYSATKAGYARPDVSATELMKSPVLQEEIRRQQLAKLFSTALPAAVNTLITIMSDEKAATGARVQAAKIVLDRTLGAQDGGQSKAPHEMTAEELQAELAQSKLRLAALESTKAERARPVIEGESATTAPETPQPVDWLDD